MFGANKTRIFSVDGVKGVEKLKGFLVMDWHDDMRKVKRGDDNLRKMDAAYNDTYK